MSEQNLTGNAYAQRVRLLFRKEGTSAYISHLDLMRTMVRMFLRAGLSLRHSEGFNPRPYISLVRPLSLGYESGEELCDIVLTAPCDLETLPERLNAVSPAGITVYRVLTEFAPGRDIFWSCWCARVKLPDAMDPSLPEQLSALWRDPTLAVTKKTKSGKDTQVCIAPQIRDVIITCTDARTLEIRFAARDEAAGSLNPAFLFSAAEERLASFRPELVEYRRLGYLDGRGNPVR